MDSLEKTFGEIEKIILDRLKPKTNE